MGKTVTMRKGVIYADIFDSSETIAQAQKDGYHLCNETETAARDALSKANVVTSEGVTPPAQVPLTEQTTTTATTWLAALSKEELLAYIGKRKLFEKSYKDLEPAAIIPLFLKAVQAKIVAAKLKTEIEAAALPEEELLDLFHTLK